MKMKKSALTIGIVFSMVAMMAFSGCELSKNDNKDTTTEKDTTKTTTSADGTTKAGGTTTKSASTTKAATATEFKKGTVTATSFESSYLNLKFTAPAGFKMATDEQLLKVVNKGADLAGIDPKTFDYAKASAVYEMMVSNASGSANIIVMEEKLASKVITQDVYLDALEKGLTAMTAIKYTFDPDRKDVTFVGQKYKQMSVTGVASGQTILQEYYSRMIGDRAVDIIITYTKDTVADKDTLLKAFSAMN